MSEDQKRWVLNAPRRCALGRLQRWAVFAGICAIGVTFALFVALLFDAWVVLPFTGIELLAVGVAFGWWDLHARDFEAVVIFESGVMRVVRQYGRRQSVVELPAAWSHISREDTASGWGKRRRLVIACKGQRVTFGEFLDEAGANECYRLLRERIKAAWA